MTLNELSLDAVRRELSHTGLTLRTGPFICRVQSRVSSIAEGLFRLYSDNEVYENARFADFHISVDAPHNVRRFVRKQVVFSFDGRVPFKPLAYDQAFPMVEWGLNWCITSHCFEYLIIHAAVLECRGRAVILPGAPGSGKSTLTAALAHRGWRLLSDELTLLTLDASAVVPIARPVSLKNESIDVIRNYARESVFSTIAHDTAKGSVAHMKAPRDAVRQSQVNAEPAWIIFPRYVKDAPPQLHPVQKGTGLVRLAQNSFNYPILGARGFDALKHLSERCDYYTFEYGFLDDAIRVFNALLD